MDEQDLCDKREHLMSKTREIRRIVTGASQVDGAGVKLVRVVGRADISVIQLSIDETPPPIIPL